MSNQSNPDETVASPPAETGSSGRLTAPRICHNPNCGFRTREPLNRCPHCGRPMLTPIEFRLLSILLVFCGVALAAIGGGLIFLTSGFKSSEIKGGAAAQIVIFGIFAVILSFGLSVMAAGFWQIAFGRANKKLIYILLAILLALMIIVTVGRAVLTLLSSSPDS